MSREFAIGLKRIIDSHGNHSQSADFEAVPLRGVIHVEESAESACDSISIVHMQRVHSEKAWQTPDWMKIRLIEAGFGLHHVVVDVLNYVLLETGQPMHAYSGALTDAFSVGYALATVIANAKR